MPLFNPARPPPPLSDAAIAAQLAAYAARPPRILQPRYVWIVTGAGDVDLGYVDKAVFGANRVISAGCWRVLITPHDPARDYIEARCGFWEVEYNVKAERIALGMCQTIVAWDRIDIMWQAVRRGIPCWHNRRTVAVQMRLPLVAA